MRSESKHRRVLRTIGIYCLIQAAALLFIARDIDRHYQIILFTIGLALSQTAVAIFFGLWVFRGSK